MQALIIKIIILGDFNIHVDTVCSNTTQLISLLNFFDLIQNINFPTHTHGHTLDRVCTSGLNNISVSGLAIPISDHKFIIFNVSYRHVNAVDISTFSASIASSAIPEI